MRAYILTRSDFFTDDNRRWGKDVEYTAPGGNRFNSESYIFAYRSPLQAAFFAPIHVNNHPVLWEGDADVVVARLEKLGCMRLRTICQIPLPELTTEQRVAIAIRCVKLVCRKKKWNKWADRWLSGEDRSAEAARAMTAKYGAVAEAWWATSAAAYSAVPNESMAARHAAFAVAVAEDAGADAADIFAIIEGGESMTLDEMKTRIEQLEARLELLELLERLEQLERAKKEDSTGIWVVGGME